MSTKRVILATGSRLLREMLQRVIDETEHLAVVEQISGHEKLAPAIERLDPAWVILTAPDPTPDRVNAWYSQYPSVRFMVLSPDYSRIRIRSHNSMEEDLSLLTLKGFIDVLEGDLQHT